MKSKSGLEADSRNFGSRLSFSNGQPNQRNAKTAVSATGSNVSKKKSQNRVGKKKCV